MTGKATLVIVAGTLSKNLSQICSNPNVCITEKHKREFSSDNQRDIAIQNPKGRIPELKIRDVLAIEWYNYQNGHNEQCIMFSG